MSYISLLQLSRMANHHKMMCRCSIWNISNYLQVSLNMWRLSPLQMFKVTDSSSCGRLKSSVIATYNVDAYFICPVNELHHTHCEEAE